MSGNRKYTLNRPPSCPQTGATSVGTSSNPPFVRNTSITSYSTGTLSPNTNLLLACGREKHF